MNHSFFKIVAKISLVYCFVTHSALAIVPFDELSSLPADKVSEIHEYQTIKFPPIINDKLEQKRLFDIIDYFSTHYPYSKPQIGQYFDSDFKTIKSDDNTYFIANIFTTENYKLNIKDVDFRDGKKGQLLIFNLRQPVCYESEYLTNLLKAQGYGFRPEMNSPYYGGMMDKSKQVGEIRLGIADYEVDKKSNQLECIDSLIFDTFENFDKSYYVEIE